MFRSPSAPRHALFAMLVTGAVLLTFGCTNEADPGSAPTSMAPGSTPGTAPATVTDGERLAQAKTVAVGFFEAQAVNDHDRALERSSGAAALTIEWARGVNAIAAANDSGYQVPSVEAPNVRVQIDGLTADGSDGWVADGFVELSFRPGPVVSTTSTTSPTPEASAPGAPATFAVDLVFSGDGDELRLADYRLDDVPYPVSQLFTALEAAPASASGVEGSVTLGHRDLDGSVQYLVDLDNGASTEATGGASSFTSAPPGTPGTDTIPAGPDSIDGTTFADPVPANGTSQALIVFPGAFPGSAGTLALAITTIDASTETEPGDATSLGWALPDFPVLTPRPVGTMTASSATTSTTTSSTTSSTTTSSSSPPTTAQAPAPTPVPTSTPTTSQPTSTSTTTSSTTTTMP